MISSGDHISDAGGRCLRLFDSLSRSLETKNASSVSCPGILDEYARFRIWADNIGALLNSEQRNSLDFRLRNAPKVSIRVIEFLEDLEEALQDSKTHREYLTWSSADHSFSPVYSDRDKAQQICSCFS